jgi:primosomal protein N' (replication factor Y)
MQTIKFFGLGTQKLEEEARKAFPQAKVARLDSDISRSQGAYLEVLRDFKNRKIDILIGTQMIAKGLDLPHLSTVGVVAADTSFMQLDYQAEERGFQLLTQVAGRAGRRDKQGRVIFQTYSPERQALVQAAKQDYRDFYNREVEERKLAGYPPYSTLLRVVSQADDDTDAIEALNNLHSYLLEHTTSDSCNILGPSPCVLAKLKGKHRYHLLIKTTEPKTLSLIKDLCMAFKQKLKGELLLSIDVGSISLY